MSDPDPLTAFVARSVRGEVSDVGSAPLPPRSGAQIERITFRQDGRRTSLVLKRVERERSLEVQLLPFLAARTEHVPAVRSRGIPPAAVPARPWVLVEDTLDAPSACDDLRAVLRAKLAVEAAVARDAPALRALGVPAFDELGIALASDDRARLARDRAVLVHGALRCSAVRRAASRVVIDDWAAAHVGSGLVDVAALALEASGVWAAYTEVSGRAVDAADAAAASRAAVLLAARADR